jgi:hypothetical protein
VLKAAEKKLPICLRCTQWEHLLYAEERTFSLPPDDNPCFVDLDGKVHKQVSPFGPVQHWGELGRAWTDTPEMRALEAWYPDPPYVLVLSNNEAKALKWKNAERSRRFTATHGTDTPDTLRQRVVGEGYIERYKALFDGMRAGAARWGARMRFIGYAYDGRTDFFPLERRFTPYAWDGTSMRTYLASYDNGKSDFTAHSPQIGAMNQVMKKKWYRQIKPDCFWEVSVWWDSRWPEKMKQALGDAAGTFPPERYRGLVQWVMWLARPQAVRDFTGWTTLREKQWDIYRQVVEAVDRVHADPILTQFWQHGRPVINRGVEIPLHADIVDPTGVIPDTIKQVDYHAFYGLDTNLDPPKPYNEGGPVEDQSTFRVFAQAHVLGAEPNRRWLVYAHAPRGDETGVTITIPGYGPIRMDVSQAGSFCEVTETDRGVRVLAN